MSQIRNGKRTTGVAATTTKTDSANATIPLMSREAMRTCKPPRLLRRLTVNLRGRTTTPDKRRGRTLSPGARGAKPLTHHGPLQRARQIFAANPFATSVCLGTASNVTGLGIAPKRVRAPLALQIAAVMAQMPQQSTAFHSTVTVSRVTPLGRPRSASARRSRRIRAIAAARLFRAAAFVRPCPFAPGTSAQYATNHLPSRSIIAVNSFRMAPLYRARALAPWPSNGEAEGPGTGA